MPPSPLSAAEWTGIAGRGRMPDGTPIKVHPVAAYTVVEIVPESGEHGQMSGMACYAGSAPRVLLEWQTKRTRKALVEIPPTSAVYVWRRAGGDVRRDLYHTFDAVPNPGPPIERILATNITMETLRQLAGLAERGKVLITVVRLRPGDDQTLPFTRPDDPVSYLGAIGARIAPTPTPACQDGWITRQKFYFDRRSGILAWELGRDQAFATWTLYLCD
jgi:hypothetical protein